jgi:hypothetical protein
LIALAWVRVVLIIALRRARARVRELEQQLVIANYRLIRNPPKEYKPLHEQVTAQRSIDEETAA